MKTEMAGSVRMAGDVGRGVEVHIHLEEETLTLVADGGGELGTWPLDEWPIDVQRVDENGVDLSLIEYTLAQSPAERLTQLEGFVERKIGRIR